MKSLEGEKRAAQATLAVAPRQASTPAEIRDLFAGLTAVTKALKQADGEAKAEVYSALGLHLTYRPNQRQVDVIAAPKAVDVSACRRTVRHRHYTSHTPAAMVRRRQQDRVIRDGALGVGSDDVDVRVKMWVYRQGRDDAISGPPHRARLRRA